MVLVLAVFVYAVALVVGGFYALTKLPGCLQERQLNARLIEVTTAGAHTDEAPDELVKTHYEGPLPALDRLATGTAQGSALAAWV